jgi:hypothetical protein
VIQVERLVSEIEMLVGQAERPASWFESLVSCAESLGFQPERPASQVESLGSQPESQSESQTMSILRRAESLVRNAASLVRRHDQLGIPNHIQRKLCTERTSYPLQCATPRD